MPNDENTPIPTPQLVPMSATLRPVSTAQEQAGERLINPNVLRELVQQAPQDAARGALLALAAAHRVWCRAFNQARGALTHPSRDMPDDFAIEYLARCMMHDAVAAACDGAPTELASLGRQHIAALLGPQVEQTVVTAVAALYKDDEAGQQKA